MLENFIVRLSFDISFIFIFIFSEGNMRVDANVSIRVDGEDYPRTEIKNINSIRILKSAIENEISRQKKLLNEGEEIKTVTLNLDENGEVIVVRGKGDSLDYRFTPEPNLPRLKIEREWVAEAERNIKGDADHLIYIEKYNIQPIMAINVVVSFSVCPTISKHFMNYLER